jgi:hypothetical protein
MVTDWPRPTGSGATLMKAKVATDGFAAIAFGASIIEVPIEIVRIAAIIIAIILFFIFAFGLFLSFYLNTH